MAKLKCLYSVRDDLHAFAEHALNTLTFAQMNAPLSWMVDHTAVQCAILHREGPYQVELVVARPGIVIPVHTHPGTDSIEYTVSGGVRLHVDGRDLTDTMDEDRFFAFMKGKGVRIPADALHGGQVHPVLGAMFLSFQRWEGPHDHIGHNYQGCGVSPEHDALKGCA